MVVLILMTEIVLKIMIDNVTELVVVTEVMLIPVSIVIFVIVKVMSISMIIMSIILFVETVVASQSISWFGMVHVMLIMYWLLMMFMVSMV